MRQAWRQAHQEEETMLSGFRSCLRQRVSDGRDIFSLYNFCPHRVNKYIGINHCNSKAYIYVFTEKP
jgi:hypothetical protein